MNPLPPASLAVARAFRTRVRSDDPIVRDHRVHARRVMPGVTFLDLFERAALTSGLAEGRSEFRHILFPAAIAVPEGEACELEIVMTPAGGHWDVVARSRPAVAANIPAAGWTINARAECHPAAVLSAPAFDLDRARAQAVRVVDVEELYTRLRQHGIQHFDFMKPAGQVHRSAAGALAEVRLSPAAAKYAGHFSLHPVFLDFATGVSFFAGYADERYAGGPFIPISIDRFQAAGMLGRRCFIWVPARPEPEPAGGDLGRDPEILLLSERGETLARFGHLTFKRIRTSDALARASAPPRTRSAPAHLPVSEKNAPAARADTAAPVAPVADPLAAIARELQGMVGATLGIDAAAVDPSAGFYDLGLESTDLLALARQLEARIGQVLYPTLLFEYPNIRELTAYLRDNYAGAFAAPTSKPDSALLAPAAAAPASVSNLTAELRAFGFGWENAPRAAPLAPVPTAPGDRRRAAWLVFAPDDAFAGELEAARPTGTVSGGAVIALRAGAAFRRHGPQSFEVRADAREDYVSLLATLSSEGIAVAGALHFWSIGWAPLGCATVGRQMATGLQAILAFSQALLGQGQRDPLRLLCFHDGATPEPSNWAVAGFLAGLRREAPHLEGRIVGLPFTTADWQAALRLAWLEATHSAPDGVVQSSVDHRRAWRPRATLLPVLAPGEIAGGAYLRPRGVYLITGGAGGLGRSLARHLVARHDARVMLVGRSQASAETSELLRELTQSGSDAAYLQADVADGDQMAAVIAETKARFGALHGVFHAAGVLHDGLVVAANEENTGRVLRPKVDGTLVLDDVTRDEPLDFFALFSSLSAVTGNSGQAIYGAANRFMDGFADWRNAHVAAGSRSGRSVAIDWPLWADGGMQVSTRNRERLARETGMLPLEAAAGWAALESILAGGNSPCALAWGNGAKISALLGVTDTPTEFDSGISVSDTSDAEIRDEDIAIIGASGRYPQASDLNAFHTNLAGGRDCISVIPRTRWDHAAYFDADRTKAGKCYSQWGGFLDEVDRFDPQFFNLSPREAELMDPQERLFLECAWSALEDAGYTRSGLAAPGLERRVGVFVGVMWGGYQLFGAEELMHGRVVTANSPYWSIANRISYFFDLCGPSFAVDSACSSSLTALHLACESVLRNECRLAIVGGVNLSLHPTKYLLLSQMGMLSTHGRCKTFGAGADGYTPGEGVGALVVKRARDAIAAGDTIHAIVKGSALNHDGRANGFTVPNPQAQTRVIAEALQRAGVLPRAVSYIEAHGTGTALGDPVEIAGLTRAFRADTAACDYCAIGSVKSVIGHLEAAAGVSAVTKVLLQFRHRQLFPSLHAGQPNPDINFTETPFHVQHELAEWPRPRVEVDGRWLEQPRIAGVSSFGAGGANVHVILQEPPAVPARGAAEVPPLLVLSAQNRDRLQAVARRLREHLTVPPPDWTDLLFTLQTGRESLDERLALIADRSEAITARLDAFLEGRPADDYWTGRFSRKAPPSDSASAERIIAGWIAGGALSGDDCSTLARFWAAGGTIDWRRLARGRPRRISLPTYPFAGKRFWIPQVAPTAQPQTPAPLPAPIALDAATPAVAAVANAPESTASDASVWLFKPDWQERPTAALPRSAGTVVLFGGDDVLARALARGLAPDPLVQVRPGDRFAVLGDGAYSIRKDDAGDYTRLFSELERDNPPVQAVVVVADDPAWAQAQLESAPPPAEAGLLETLFHLGRAGLTRPTGASPRLLVVTTGSDGRNALAAAAGGFLRSLQLELPRIRTGLLATDATEPNTIAASIIAELAAGDFEIRIRQGVRLCRCWSPCDPETDLVRLTAPTAAAVSGAVVITGGAGGIGLHLARHLAQQGPARIAVLGRSPLPAGASWAALLAHDLTQDARRKVEAFAAIERLGGEVMYLATDITHSARLARALDAVRQRFGRITGLLHCAGVTDDRSLARKSPESFRAVIAPKLRGTLLLDQLTRHDPLEYVILFSSVTAVTGNLGQCDYAAGNAFLDEFAAWREHWRLRGLRAGRTLSVNWPLWRDAGMQADPEVARALAHRGMTALSAEDGIRAFDTARALLTPQVMVWAGDPTRFQVAVAPAVRAPESTRVPPSPASAADSPVPALVAYLARHLAEVLKLETAEIDPDREFSDHGVDSIAAKELVLKINRDLGDLLDPFVMAEKNTLQRLAEHLAALNATAPGARPADAPLPTPAPTLPIAPSVTDFGTITSSVTAPAGEAAGSHLHEEIAVIGMAAKFPGANTMAEFWDNLVQGRRAIREVPPGRWSVSGHFSPDADAHSKSYSKWGGFIDDLEEFDPEFFGLSETAGQLMDPLHRLFLEVSARAMEDAGYQQAALDTLTAGVFVGAKQGTYAETVGLDRLLATDAAEAWRFNSACMITSRLAEFLNLCGPAYVIDTACSSSLVAVHAACESLRRGECGIALAGGVEALVGPAAFIHFSQSKSLSPTGECRPFESGADGTVLGEGAGAVVLKPLTAALRDGDHIHAVVRGSSVNNFGAAADAPARVATMKQVMRQACRTAGLGLGDIGYLELHGEGSLLRDALELRAIKELWEEQSSRSAAPCPIGTVKANIGHLLLASGIAGFVKSCLMLGHRQIPRHPFAAGIARFAGLADTPYGFAAASAAWPAPGAGRRRTIGVNATGIAGTNCFLLCSEWPQPTPQRALAPRPMHKRRLWLASDPVDATPAPAADAALPTHVCANGGHGVCGGHEINDGAVPAAPNPVAAPAAEAPDLSRLQDELGAICRRILRVPEVDPATSFFELGMDSFKILQLFHEVSRHFGYELDPTRLAQFPSLTLLARHLHESDVGRTAGTAPDAPPAPGKNGGFHGNGSNGHATPVPGAPCACAADRPPSLASPAPATTCAAAGIGATGSDAACDLDFGLYFFANYDHAVGSGKYRLLLDAVKYADANGFSSVFTPERHFEDFGGLYPNPSVVGAALAAITRQIHIRAGSVVSPLHDPLRIAEDWAVVDNISDGRAGVSFTYGWQCDDFVLFPDRYLKRHAQMFEQIDTVRKLWRGESVERENGLGRKVQIRTFPRPIQAEIPIWVTCAISRDSFVNAGRVGANVVTFLLGQGLGDLKEKIAAYRAALAESGFDPASGRVSLMVHTFLGDDVEAVKQQVRAPFLTFIRAQAQLARNLVHSVDPSSDLNDPKITDALMDIGFTRFFGDSGLMGTVASCRDSVRRFKALGVDELSCLIDFGLDHEAVMGSLRRLKELKDSFPPSRKPRDSFPDQAARGGKTPVSFTPVAAPAPTPDVPAQDGGNAEADRFGTRLDTFRSYLPGGSRVPGAPAGHGPASSNGRGTDPEVAHPTPPESNGNGAASPITPAPDAPADSPHDPFPLTAVQKAYWMGRNPQLELGGTSTHGYVELRVALDLPRFAAALQRVIDRHPMLRAVVSSGREQRVLPGRLEYRLPIVDLSGLDVSEQQKRLLEERERQSHRIFDPATWPLFDFKAFILGPGRQYLLFGFDSLIADASSLTIVFREIMELHDHPERVLPDIAFTFRDYLNGYESFRSSPDYLRDRTYWMERIPALPAAPDIPLRKDPADVRQPRFTRLDATIDQPVWAAAKDAARRNFTTPTVLLFTAFAQVLAAVGQRREFSLNLTVFNRLPLHPEVNRIVGDFTALMLVAATYRPERTFWENAATMQGAVLKALGHRNFDGVEVIKELARQRNLLGRAVIPVVFTSNLLNTENGEDGLSAMGEVAYMITQTTQAYLDNQVAENRRGLYIAWDFVAELFEPAVIEGMFRHYVRIVGELGGLAPVPVSASRMPAPTDAFVARYNATDDPSIRPSTLAAQFQAQARRTPDGTALLFGQETLTYRELDRRSNQVAHYLQGRGIGRGDLVGLITPRAISTIVNTLGIVKSGAAYVPVDPDYPEARQRYIFEQAGATVVLDGTLHDRIRLESPASPFACPSQPDDLAYIIFTSGSTGQPKGVMITHGAVTNTLIDLNRRFAVGADDRVLGLSSMCFDLSVYDVFGTLAAGACLVLIDDIRNPQHLARTTREQRITIWNSVPTLFRMLVDAAEGDLPSPDLRLVMMSGDWIPITLPTAALRRFPGARLYSLGGATEASIWSIYFPITEVKPDWVSIPYGYPLANQSFYVLDEQLEFCPVGTPGQLYIGGTGLSTGYFKDQAKTAQAYFVHPRLGRLYRTGDWGVWREAGYIEFLGRRDHQVKIRGFRVELGEIEARLLKHPSIRQAVILDRVDASGNRSLCAYLVRRSANSSAP